MKKYDCQFSEDFQIAKHPDYCHKGNFQLQFKPEIKDKRLKEKAREKIFNKLAFIGSQGQKYLNEIVFPFISQEIENAKKEERERILKEIDKGWTGEELKELINLI